MYISATHLRNTVLYVQFYILGIDNEVCMVWWGLGTQITLLRLGNNHVWAPQTQLDCSDKSLKNTSQPSRQHKW